MQLPIKVKAHVTVHPGFMCMYLAMDTADELEELEPPGLNHQLLLFVERSPKHFPLCNKFFSVQ